jgi:hypothetical protein
MVGTVQAGDCTSSKREESEEINYRASGGSPASHGSRGGASAGRTVLEIPTGGGRYLKYRPPLVHLWPLDRTRTAQIGRAGDSVVIVRLVCPGAGTSKPPASWRRLEAQVRRTRTSRACWSTPIGSLAEDAWNFVAASIENSPRGSRALVWATVR